MHIVLFGAGGQVAQRIAREALNRDHRVTAVVLDRKRFKTYDDRLTVVEGSATDPASVARVSSGADAIVNAISPRPHPDGRSGSSLVDAARALIQGAKRAGVKRLVIVGGAGSLEVAPGKQLVDSPDFPAAYKPEALAHRDALAVYRAEAGDLEWTNISPAALFTPGERTGKYRTGDDQLLADKQGKSFITFEDYAIAVLDELERPKHAGRRMTVAY
jgi:uncharacterized protein